MAEADNAEPVVVLGVEGEIAADADSHADLNIALHRLSVVKGQHHIGCETAALERLLHPLAQLAFRGGQNQWEGSDVLESDRFPVQ